MCYVFSYAFQLSGALLLLFWSLKGIKKNILELYFPGTNIIERDEDDNCTLLKEVLQKNAKKIVLNIFSFGNLVVGYLLAVIAEKTLDNCKTLILVIVLTVAIICVEYILTVVIAIKKYPENILVPYSQLKPYNVDTIVTEAEIEQMCAEIFASNEDV